MPLGDEKGKSKNVEYRLVNIDGDFVASIFVDPDFSLEEILEVDVSKWKLASEVERKTKRKEF